MKSTYSLVLILFLALSFMVSCNNEKDSKPTKTSTAANTTSQDKKSEVVFYINDRPVSKGQLTGPNLQAAINNEVIYEMAVKQNLDKDQDVLNKIEIYKKNHITSKIKSQVIKDYLAKTIVTDEQIEAYYEEIKNRYSILDLTQIMLDDEETAKAVYTKLSNSDNIMDTIKQEKEAGVKIVTKELKQTKNYDRFFKNIKEGELSDSIKGKNKYSIYKIDKIDYTPLDQIKQQLQYQLTSKNRTKAIEEYVEKSIADNNIKIKKVN